MLKAGILPDSKNYNLLLRTARDCGIGNPALATSLLLRPVEKSEGGNLSSLVSKRLIDIDLLERQLFIQADPLGESQQPSRSSEEEESHSQQDMTQLLPINQSALVPVHLADGAHLNLLDVFEGKVGGLIALGSVDGASDRLALIGGAKGFLDKMESNGLSPDLRTLTLLADTMEPGYTSLQVLLKVAKKHKIKLDPAFFNTAIHTAARAGDPEGAKVHASLVLKFSRQIFHCHCWLWMGKIGIYVSFFSFQAVLRVMQQRNVSVNTQTFGCLALSCGRQKDALQLLSDMEVMQHMWNITNT